LGEEKAMMHQVRLNPTSPPASCSVCGGKFGPFRMGQVFAIDGRVDIVCKRCDLWLFELVYTGQIGPIKEWVFKEIH